jgi:hypothetical protein
MPSLLLLLLPPPPLLLLLLLLLLPPTQLSIPEYQAFLDFMCPGYQQTGVFPPWGSDPAMCSRCACCHHLGLTLVACLRNKLAAIAVMLLHRACAQCMRLQLRLASPADRRPPTIGQPCVLDLLVVTALGWMSLSLSNLPACCGCQLAAFRACRCSFVVLLNKRQACGAAHTCCHNFHVQAHLWNI